MGGGFQFLDIIIFAMIALFLVIRLRNVLGRRTGHERDHRTVSPLQSRSQQGKDGASSTAHGNDQGGDNVVSLPDRAAAAPPQIPDGPAAAGLREIVRNDQSFRPEQFVGGARAAFEMIVKAFAEGDTATLRPLLSDSVMRNFEGVIDGRKAEGQTQETTLIGLKSVEITEAGISGTSTAWVTVTFVSEQVNVLKDDEGRIIEGDPNYIAEITDIWTFERDTRSPDPNWQLSATRSPD